MSGNGSDMTVWFVKYNSCRHNRVYLPHIRRGGRGHEERWVLSIISRRLMHNAPSQTSTLDASLCKGTRWHKMQSSMCQCNTTPPTQQAFPARTAHVSCRRAQKADSQKPAIAAIGRFLARIMTSDQVSCKTNQRGGNDKHPGYRY